MSSTNEVDVSPLLEEGRFGRNHARRELINAIDLASDQGRMSWLVDASGKRIAAIVTVDVAEAAEQAIADVLATPVGRPE